VGVHPDSLGKQFKNNTGCSLKKYIYELRVNEVARRLSEGEAHIIDMVFDVGFNSVKAFKRIFSKFLNEYPCNYGVTNRAVG